MEARNQGVVACMYDACMMVWRTRGVRRPHLFSSGSQHAVSHIANVACRILHSCRVTHSRESTRRPDDGVAVRRCDTRRGGHVGAALARSEQVARDARVASLGVHAALLGLLGRSQLDAVHSSDGVFQGSLVTQAVILIQVIVDDVSQTCEDRWCSGARLFACWVGCDLAHLAGKRWSVFELGV